jgi:hypothetical protein
MATSAFGGDVKRENVKIWLWIVCIWLATAVVSLLALVTTEADPGGTELIASGVAVLALVILSAVSATIFVLVLARGEGPDEAKSCPRCRGDVNKARGAHGEYSSCFQCGWYGELSRDPYRRWRLTSYESPLRRH